MLGKRSVIGATVLTLWLPHRPHTSRAARFGHRCLRAVSLRAGNLETKRLSRRNPELLAREKAEFAAMTDEEIKALARLLIGWAAGVGERWSPAAADRGLPGLPMLQKAV